jgi:hypothetical protein
MPELIEMYFVFVVLGVLFLGAFLFITFLGEKL